jgi:hypothetical protein
MENLIPRGFAVLQHGDPKEGNMEKEFNRITCVLFQFTFYKGFIFLPGRTFSNVLNLFLNLIAHCQASLSRKLFKSIFLSAFFYSLDSILL